MYKLPWCLNPGCLSIRDSLRPDMFCRFDDNCLTVLCCVDADQFVRQGSLSLTVQVDPCAKQIILGAGDVITSLDIHEDMGWCLPCHIDKGNSNTFGTGLTECYAGSSQLQFSSNCQEQPHELVGVLLLFLDRS